MRGAWSVISAVQESGRHREQQESPNTASRHHGDEGSDTGNLIVTPVIRNDLLRDYSCYSFELNILDLCLSRFYVINNWSEARSMGSGNKASSERERLKTAMWNNFFLIEWSRVHHQYHFLPLLLWHHSPASLGPSPSASLFIIIRSCASSSLLSSRSYKAPNPVTWDWNRKLIDMDKPSPGPYPQSC